MGSTFAGFDPNFAQQLPHTGLWFTSNEKVSWLHTPPGVQLQPLQPLHVQIETRVCQSVIEAPSWVS